VVKLYLQDGDSMKTKDDLSVLLDALQKREEVLIKNQSVRKYNKYFDIMRKSAHAIIEQGRQSELLPYLESDSISIQRDVAGLLFNSYPNKCREVLTRISEMSVQTGLPKHLGNVRLSACDALQYGIPKDFP